MPDETKDGVYFENHATGSIDGVRPLESVVHDLDPEAYTKAYLDGRAERYIAWSKWQDKIERADLRGARATPDHAVPQSGEELEIFLGRRAQEKRIAAGLPEPRLPVVDHALQATARELVHIDARVNPLDPHAPGLAVALLLRRALGEERAAALGLTASSFPLQVVSAVIGEVPEVFETALRGRPARLFALRMSLAQMVTRTSFPSRHSEIRRDCVDGIALRRSWERLPAAGRALFGESTDEAIEALAVVSPNGEIRADNSLDFALAIVVDGEFSKWLQEKVAEVNR